MIITNIRVIISPSPTDVEKESTKEKMIQMSNGLWDCPGQLFAREVRFLSGLEALVNEFNKFTPRNK